MHNIMEHTKSKSFKEREANFVNMVEAVNTGKVGSNMSATVTLSRHLDHFIIAEHLL